jgi:hypothetical protein
MTRVTSSSVREIDKIEFTIECLECLEYNGVWKRYGWRVSFNGKPPITCIGYPSDKDLQKFAKYF